MKRGTIEHPKLLVLCSLLNIEKFGAVGILEMMWHFTAKYAPQGDIGRYSDSAIAKAVDWKRPTGARGVTPECKLSGALVMAKWLDSDPVHRLIVHHWEDHCDQSVRKFLSRHGLDFVRPVNSLPLPLPLPLPFTTANSQKPVLCAPTNPKRASEFVLAFPEHSNDNLTVQQYLSVVDPSEEDLVFACLERYKASDAVARGIFQTGSNWLQAQKANGWRGEWPAVRKPPSSRKSWDEILEEMKAEDEERMAK